MLDEENRSKDENQEPRKEPRGKNS